MAEKAEPIRALIEWLVTVTDSCDDIDICPDCGACWGCIKREEIYWPYLRAFIGG